MFNRNPSDSTSDDSQSQVGVASESKYVADILSSMANGEPAAPTATYTLPAYASGVTTGTTPTLTPTTLASIEQTFIELQSVPVNSGGHDPLTQSGFVPPIVDPISGSDQTPGGTPDHYDYSDSDQEWMGPATKTARQISGKAVVTGTSYPSARGRKSRRLEEDPEFTSNASPEEIERRRIRRERNKVAAAKCRQRRVDHTNRLISETDKLEDEKSTLESEIQTLQKQKDQLEFILQAHKPLCKADGIMDKTRIKAEFHSACGAETDHSSNGAVAFPNGMPTIKQEVPDYVDEYGSQCALKPDHHSLHPCSRPSTLPLQAKPAQARSLAQVTLSSATGISITTPSSGFFSFDGFEGHSGLTPIGGPSCASQIHRNSADNSPDGVTSPTLISL